MAHSFISRMQVKPDKQREFIQLCREMEALVKAHEPDTLVYKFYRLDDPNGFAVIESFKDEVADKAHQEAEHAKPVIEKMLPCLADGYSRELLHDLD